MLEIWHNGTPIRVPESLGQNFQDDLISSILENLYSTNQTCLSFDQKMMKCFGLDLDCAANISESQIELHTKLVKGKTSLVPLHVTYQMSVQHVE